MPNLSLWRIYIYISTCQQKHHQLSNTCITPKNFDSKAFHVNFTRIKRILERICMQLNAWNIKMEYGQEKFVRIRRANTESKSNQTKPNTLGATRIIYHPINSFNSQKNNNWIWTFPNKFKELKQFLVFAVYFAASFYLAATTASREWEKEKKNEHKHRAVLLWFRWVKKGGTKYWSKNFCKARECEQKGKHKHPFQNKDIYNKSVNFVKFPLVFRISCFSLIAGYDFGSG